MQFYQYFRVCKVIKRKANKPQGLQRFSAWLMNKLLMEKGKMSFRYITMGPNKTSKPLNDSSPSLSSSSNPGSMGVLFLTVGSENPQLCGLAMASTRRTFHWKLNPFSAQRPSHASHSFPQALKTHF